MEMGLGLGAAGKIGSKMIGCSCTAVGLVIHDIVEFQLCVREVSL